MSPLPTFVPIARVTRGDDVESWHHGAAAVVTPRGELVARLGSPDVVTHLRSAAKPFQAQVLLAAGGEEAFDLDDADIALLCASHAGRSEHAERAASLLERGGFGVDDLLCGVHEPLGEEAARALREAGEEPTPLHNNCSGKHAGMLLACRRHGWSTEDYVAMEHPLQVEIRHRLARAAGVEADSLGVAVDGCSVATFALPLTAAARAWATLAHPRGAEGVDLDDAERVGLERTLAAMAAAPEMVAGPGRFTTRLAEVTRGRVIGKEGAEGVYAVAVRGPTALGVVLKVADGAGRCRDGVTLEMLRLLGALAQEEFEELESFYAPERTNHRGLVVGRIEPDLELEAP